MDADRQFSVHVSRALDCLGKSQDMVKFRVQKHKQHGQYITHNDNYSTERIIAGSKCEGLTSLCESDFDIMTVLNGVMGADDTSSIIHPGVIVFETERRETSPGYTKLRLDRFESMNTQPLIRDSLIKDENGQLYLSSDCFIGLFKNSIKRDFDQSLDRSGPSQPYSGTFFTEDLVAALRCICPYITHSFITRHRDYGWPSDDQLAETSTLEGHVVSVGYKGSDTAFLEWRICYTKAERFLMCSLNDTQTKLYIMLKMVAKTYLNSTSKEITSYVLKNIVLWLAEFCDVENFKEELLVDRLIQALEFLRQCITNNYLPSYMIPERNLFSHKLDLVQRQNLVILLAELKHEGGRLLMGCERLRGTMIVLLKEPVVAEQYRYKRDIIEKLSLKLINKGIEARAYDPRDMQNLLRLFTGEDSSQTRNLVSTLYNMIGIPDQQSLRQQGHDFQSIVSIYEQRWKLWLS